MSCSDQIVKKIYGGRLALSDNHEYAHHLFTFYEDVRTKEQYFLRTVQLPAYLHISEGIADLVIKKYQHLLTPTKIIPIERTFHTCTYLLRVPQNVILLTNFLQIKKDCKEVMQVEFFRKFLIFLLNSYQIIDNAFLPLYGIHQIGINDSKQFVLCDPALYFRKEEVIPPNQSFGAWAQQLLKQFLNLPLNPGQYQEFLKQKLDSHFNALWPIISYLLSGNATFEGTQAKLLPNSSRISEGVSTVTFSQMDVNQIFERGAKSSIKKNKEAFKKIGKLGRMMIIFILVGVLLGVSYFVFQFFNRKITCQEGFYLSNLSQCLGCSDGCLRCEDSTPNRCVKCSVNMYLVLDDEEDKEGFCLKECRGKLISMDVCIRKKQMAVGQDLVSGVHNPLREENVLIK